MEHAPNTHEAIMIINHSTRNTASGETLTERAGRIQQRVSAIVCVCACCRVSSRDTLNSNSELAHEGHSPR